MGRLKIGIYNPYLDTFGGGEKDVCVTAEALKEKYDVDLVTNKAIPRQMLESRLNVDLGGVNIRVVKPYVPYFSLRYPRKGQYKFYLMKLTKRYDVFINLVNWIPFPSFALKSIARVQFPFGDVPPDATGLKYYDNFLVYSDYAKKWVRTKWGVEADVLHPPVQHFEPGPKENVILSVGRFFMGDHNKKHMDMICAFKRLCDGGLKGWEYHLLGSVKEEPVHQEYLRMVKTFAKGYPVFIHENAPFSLLKQMYSKGKIFIHAAGLGEDEQTHPERYEHFGLTTVEAMSAGCVPVVINGGGQSEIVTSGENGFLFNDEKELAENCGRVIGDDELFERLSKAAVRDSSRFDKETMKKEILEYVENVIAGGGQG